MLPQSEWASSDPVIQEPEFTSPDPVVEEGPPEDAVAGLPISEHSAVGREAELRLLANPDDEDAKQVLNYQDLLGVRGSIPPIAPPEGPKLTDTAKPQNQVVDILNDKPFEFQTPKAKEKSTDFEHYLEKVKPEAQLQAKAGIAELFEAYRNHKIDIPKPMLKELANEWYKGTTPADSLHQFAEGIKELTELKDAAGPKKLLSAAKEVGKDIASTVGDYALSLASKSFNAEDATPETAGGSGEVPGLLLGLKDVGDFFLRGTRKGALNYIDYLLSNDTEANNEKRADRLVDSLVTDHDTLGTLIAAGYDPESPEVQAGRLVGNFAPIPGLASLTSKLATRVASSTVDHAIKLAAKARLPQAALRIGKAGLYGLELHPSRAVAELILGNIKGSSPWLNKVREIVFKGKATESATDLFNALREAPANMPAAEMIDVNITSEIQRQQAKEAWIRANRANEIEKVDAKIPGTDRPVFAAEELEGADREIRDIRLKIKDLETKRAQNAANAQIYRVLNDATKAALSTVITGATGATEMSVLSALGSLEPKEAGQRGFGVGAALGTAVGPKNFKESRLANTRADVIRRGKPLIQGDTSGLPQDKVDALAVLAANSNAFGKKVHVLTPEELLDKNAELNGVARTPGQIAPNGMEQNGNLYLNKHALSSGVGEHELTHLYSKQARSIFAEVGKDIEARMEAGQYQNFFDIYDKAIRKTEPNWDGLSPEEKKSEVLAELGRIATRSVPLADFYGGKPGGQIIKEYFQSKFGGPNNKTVYVDPTLGVPYTDAQIKAVRDIFYQIGERTRSFYESGGKNRFRPGRFEAPEPERHPLDAVPEDEYLKAQFEAEGVEPPEDILARLNKGAAMPASDKPDPYSMITNEEKMGIEAAIKRGDIVNKKQMDAYVQQRVEPRLKVLSAVKALQDSEKPFEVTFEKADGTMRTMQAQFGGGAEGAVRTADGKPHLYVVKTPDGPRTFNIDKVTKIKGPGVEYTKPKYMPSRERRPIEEEREGGPHPLGPEAGRKEFYDRLNRGFRRTLVPPAKPELPREQQGDLGFTEDHSFMPPAFQPNEARAEDSGDVTVHYPGGLSKTYKGAKLLSSAASPTPPLFDLSPPELGRYALRTVVKNAIQQEQDRRHMMPSPDLEMPFAPDGAQKAWVGPDGEFIPVQFAHGEWFMSHPEEAKKLGISDPYTMDDSADSKALASDAGFARITIPRGTGTAIVETNAEKWPKIKGQVQDVLLSNADNIIRADVRLLDGRKVVSRDTALVNRDPGKIAEMPSFAGERTTGGTLLDRRGLAGLAVYGGDAEGHFMPHTPEVAEHVEKLKKGDINGITFNNLTGKVFDGQSGDVVTLSSHDVPLSELTPEKIHEFVDPYEGIGDIYPGIWNSHDGKASVDINTIKPASEREQNLALARAHGQKAIYNFDSQTEIPTGVGHFMPAPPDTPNFRHWFRDSKVVDESGKPKPVYHGTAESFKAFNRKFLGKGSSTFHSDSSFGFFFAEDPESANFFAVYAALKKRYGLEAANMLANTVMNDPRPEAIVESAPKTPEGAQIVPAFLSLQNPLKVTNRKGWDALINNAPKGTVQEFRKQLIEQGHDGIELDLGTPFLSPRSYFLGTDHKHSKAYIAFNSTQIKSAIGNKGTFSPKSADIARMPATREAYQDQLGYYADLTAGLKSRVAAAKRAGENIDPQVEDDLIRANSVLHDIVKQSGDPRELVIIGGGPAGLRAGSYAAYDGTDAVILEKSERAGGQAKDSLEIKNAGNREGLQEGEKYFRDLTHRALLNGVEIQTNAGVKKVSKGQDGIFDIELENGKTMRAHRVLAASGLDWDRPPGTEGMGFGNGRRLRNNTIGKPAVVYGGGNSALQAALGAADTASHVYLIARSKFEASAEPMNRARRNPKITLIEGAPIEKVITGDDGQPAAVALADKRVFPAAWVEAFLAASPRTDFLPKEVLRTKNLKGKPKGYVVAKGPNGETAIPGLYVAGDTRELRAGESEATRRNISNAEGEGSHAAREIILSLDRDFKAGKFNTVWRQIHHPPGTKPWNASSQTATGSTNLLPTNRHTLGSREPETTTSPTSTESPPTESSPLRPPRRPYFPPGQGEFRFMPDTAIREALSADKRDKVGLHRDLPEGSQVGVRIDIPAYNRTGTYVQTVHQVGASSGGLGKVLGYDSAVALDHPTFVSNETGSQKIRDGSPKFPVATVNGAYRKDIPKEYKDWTKVGFNPKNHSYFYDKETGQPVIAGDRAVATGNTVYVENPRYGKKSGFAYMPEEVIPPRDIFERRQRSRELAAPTGLAATQRINELENKDTLNFSETDELNRLKAQKRRENLAGADQQERLIDGRFMPSKNPEAIIDTAVRTPDDKIHTGVWAAIRNGFSLEDLSRSSPEARAEDSIIYKQQREVAGEARKSPEYKAIEKDREKALKELDSKKSELLNQEIDRLKGMDLPEGMDRSVVAEMMVRNRIEDGELTPYFKKVYELGDKMNKLVYDAVDSNAPKIPSGGEPQMGSIHSEILEELESEYDDPDISKAELGYVTRDGRFLSKKDALDHAARINQIDKALYKRTRGEEVGISPDRVKSLDSAVFDDNRKFMPATEEAATKKAGLDDHFFRNVWPKLMQERASGNLKTAARHAVEDVHKFISSHPQFADYYAGDLDKTKKILDSHYGKPITDAEFKTFLLFKGLSSPNTLLPGNVSDAIEAFDHFRQEGSFKKVKLGTSKLGNTVLESTPFQIGGTTRGIKARSYKAFDELVRRTGSPEQALNYLEQPATLEELNALNRSLGYKGGIAKPAYAQKIVKGATGQDKLLPRMFVFGPKVGAYTMSLLGHSEYTTIDKWEARFIRSYLKGGFDKNIDYPQGQSEQKLFTDFSKAFSKHFHDITGERWTSSALQAARWFYILDAVNKAGYKRASTNESISRYTEAYLNRRGNPTGGGSSARRSKLLPSRAAP